MPDFDIKNYASIEEYFKDFPEEEEEYIEEMARLDAEKGCPEYPEEWPLYDWL